MKQRSLFVSIFISLFSIGCNSPKGHDAPLQNEKAIEQIGCDLFTRFNNHDWEGMANLYSDSAVFLDPSFGKEGVIQTKKQTIEKYNQLQILFPDIRDDVKNFYTTGNHVIVEFVSSGTDSTGAQIKLPIVTVFTIEKGKIIRDATYYDL